MHKFMKAFFSQPSGNPFRFVVWTVYYLLHTVPMLGITILPPIMRSLNVALVIIISSASYKASPKRLCIFSMLVCAVWMLVEIITGIVLSLIGMDGWEQRMAGTVISQMLMSFLAVIAGHYVKRMERMDIPL